MLNEENKNKMVTLRMRESDLNYLDEEAKKVKLSRSEYINRKIQSLPVQPARVPTINWETYRELSKMGCQLSAIGNNINQIAKAINIAAALGEPIPESLPQPEELVSAAKLIEEVKPLLKQIGLEVVGASNP